MVELKVAGQVSKYLPQNLHDTVDLLKKPAQVKVDSLTKKTGNGLNNLMDKAIKKIFIDSTQGFRKRSDTILGFLYKQLTPGRPLMIIKNGFINYNYTYRSRLDTPYLEKNMEQHLANISANVLIAQKIPLRVSVYERRTNSIYFRNYTDVRVEFNATEFHRLESKRLSKSFNSLINQLKDPSLKRDMGIQQKKLADLSSYLNRPDIIKKFLQSKEAVINKDELTGSPEHKDSVIKEASAFIALYEGNQKDVKNAGQSYDSLKNKYILITKKIQQLQKLFKRNINFPGGSVAIIHSLKEEGLHDRHFERLVNNLYAIRTLAIGKTMPNYTSLTVQNIGVSGINAEINKKNLYTAVVAGFIDFRVRDFVFNNLPVSKQYVSAGRLGWGRREGNHIILTGYQGRKQLFSSQAINNTASISGLSLESQFILNRNICFIAEVAQSAIAPSPGILIDSSRKGFSLKDKSSNAYSLQVRSYFPRTRTGIDGFFEHQGINFQCFNAYKANGSTNAWNLKADQYLFSGILHFTAAIHKNDYANPLIQQNYNSNTVFTNVTATFHKRLWPVVSAGYIPSSQYSIINNEVYESRYQEFTMNVNHNYKLGTSNASSTVMYNHFYNDGADSGFFYYNAKNIYLNQNILFAKYSANISISHTENPQYLLDVMQAGFGKSFKKNTSVALGVKLDHLNTEENKFGYFINIRAAISKIGILNAWAEKGYLPGIGNKLIKNEFLNVGFTRFFN